MHRSAFAVALAYGRIGWRPIGVIDAQCWTIPGALLEHLRDSSVVEIKAVLNGITAAIQRAMQANPAIGMAGNFLAPSVRFVHDGFQFFYRQRWLRNKFTIFPEPRTVRHIYFDPVRAVIELFSSCLARLDWPVNKLRSLWHIQLRRIVFQRVAARRGNRAGSNKQARPGDIPGFNRLLDLYISVSCAFGFHITQSGETLL